MNLNATIMNFLNLRQGNIQFLFYFLLLFIIIIIIIRENTSPHLNESMSSMTQLLQMVEGNTKV